jgi:hypothetical protein
MACEIEIKPLYLFIVWFVLNLFISSLCLEFSFKEVIKMDQKKNIIFNVLKDSEISKEDGFSKSEKNIKKDNSKVFMWL